MLHALRDLLAIRFKHCGMGLPNLGAVAFRQSPAIGAAQLGATNVNELFRRSFSPNHCNLESNFRGDYRAKAIFEGKIVENVP